MTISGGWPASKGGGLEIATVDNARDRDGKIKRGFAPVVVPPPYGVPQIDWDEAVRRAGNILLLVVNTAPNGPGVAPSQAPKAGEGPTTGGGPDYWTPKVPKNGFPFSTRPGGYDCWWTQDMILEMACRDIAKRFPDHYKKWNDQRPKDVKK